MKILHIIGSLDSGGAELFLLRLATEQVFSGKEIYVVSIKGGTNYELFVKAGINVIILNRNIKFATIIKSLISLRSVIKSIDPDVIQSWMYHSDLLASIVTPQRYPLIWSVRCTNVPINSKITYVIMKICSFASKFRPKRVIYVSESSREKHIEYGYSTINAVVIGNGIGNGYPYNKVTTNTEIIVGCFGRLHMDKGQDILIKAAVRICQDDSRFKFILIGREVISLIKENSDYLFQYYVGIKRIILIDELEQSELNNFYKRISIYCMPSRTEGFPNSLMEALACGIPSVASDVGDTKRLTSRLGDMVEIVKPTAVSIHKGIINISNRFFSHNPCNQGNDLLSKKSLTADSVRNQYSMKSIENMYQQLYLAVMSE